MCRTRGGVCDAFPKHWSVDIDTWLGLHKKDVHVVSNTGSGEKRLQAPHAVRNTHGGGCSVHLGAMTFFLLKENKPAAGTKVTQARGLWG